MWNKWLHTTQIEAESGGDRDHFWEISTEPENTHTGNWKLLLFFSFSFFATSYSGFQQQDTIFILNRNEQQWQNCGFDLFSVDPEEKETFRVHVEHNTMTFFVVFFFLCWLSIFRTYCTFSFFFVFLKSVVVFSVTTLPREAVTNCTSGLVSAKKTTKRTGKIKLAYVHKYTFAFVFWTPQPQRV